MGTRSATQGVDGVADCHYLVAESAEQQIEAVFGLLQDSERARGLGLAARAFVEQNYDWDTCLRPLDTILETHATKR